MTDYPEDIMKAARDIGHTWEKPDTAVAESLSRDIAAALLAERKAKVKRSKIHPRDIGEAIIRGCDARDETLAIDGRQLVISVVDGCVTFDLRQIATAIMGGSDE